MLLFYIVLWAKIGGECRCVQWSIFFGGNGSTTGSVIEERNSPALATHTANPYGRESGFSDAVELQGQHISKDNNLYGLGIAFEELTSKVTIVQLNIGGTLSALVNGKTTLQNDFIPLNPYIGHRYLYGRVSFDLLAGLDLGLCMTSRETRTISSGPEAIVNDQINKPKPSVDVRPRVQLKASLNRWGLIAGYSLGLTNYQTAGDLKAYSNFLRLGLSYQLLR